MQRCNFLFIFVSCIRLWCQYMLRCNWTALRIIYGVSSVVLWGSKSYMRFFTNTAKTQLLANTKPCWLWLRELVRWKNVFTSANVYRYTFIFLQIILNHKSLEISAESGNDITKMLHYTDWVNAVSRFPVSLEIRSLFHCHLK